MRGGGSRREGKYVAVCSGRVGAAVGRRAGGGGGAAGADAYQKLVTLESATYALSLINTEEPMSINRLWLTVPT
ncbi:hypothetical protein EVAR_41724_1 [Eumeta japonica]|uniref:Uncharacterized protein n=1 Tax=Eumeta variegata TaxID=151549 RepID=A0A4C1XHY4_EUMVA|nr:hypothetical protein EVAR_41724_1 [Eumeta japonica]